MNYISEVLRKKSPNCALIPFITAGYPTFEQSIEALYILDNKGADIIELGIPYSDALADGPIIQESSKVALDQGIHIDQVLRILSQVSHNLTSPIVIFTYYNPVLTRGIEKFITEISLNGAKGLMIPDLPLEEADYIINLCNHAKIELILFIAPTSSKVRIQSILSKSPGCIYLVSSCGVTGFRKQISENINTLVKYIKDNTNKVMILGFGISNSKQASNVSKLGVDGIVVGTAFIKSMSSPFHEEMISNLSLFCSEIRSAIDS